MLEGAILESFSEVISLYSVGHSFNTEVRNMGSSRNSSTDAHSSTVKKWLNACKSTTKKFLWKTLYCRISDHSVSFIRAEDLATYQKDPDPPTTIFEPEAIQKKISHTHSSPHSEDINTPVDDSTTESNLSLNTDVDLYSEDGRELQPSKMFASLDVNLLSLARQNLKSENFKIYPGCVKEKIEFFEKQIAELHGQDCGKVEVSQKAKVENLQEKVRFFEEFTETSNSSMGKKEVTIHQVAEERCSTETDLNNGNSQTNIAYNSKAEIVPVMDDSPSINSNPEDLIEQDRTILCLINEVHRQCHFMRQASSIIEACLKVKAFQYGKVHMEAEKLLLLAGLRRDMLLRKIRKLQFPDENQAYLKTEIVRAQISDLQFCLTKEHKNKKASFVIICSNENDMIASYVDKTKSQKGSICIPGIHSFENLHEDSIITISVYQLNSGNYFGGQRMFQLMNNEKNSKFRRRHSIQYKDCSSETLIQDIVLEPLYKLCNSVEINFEDSKQVTANYSDQCSLEGVITLELFEGRSTFRF